MIQIWISSNFLLFYYVKKITFRTTLGVQSINFQKCLLCPHTLTPYQRCCCGGLSAIGGQRPFKILKNLLRAIFSRWSRRLYPRGVELPPPQLRKILEHKIFYIHNLISKKFYSITSCSWDQNAVSNMSNSKNPKTLQSKPPLGPKSCNRNPRAFFTFGQFFQWDFSVTNYPSR